MRVAFHHGDDTIVKHLMGVPAVGHHVLVTGSSRREIEGRVRRVQWTIDTDVDVDVFVSRIEDDHDDFAVVMDSRTLGAFDG